MTATARGPMGRFVCSAIAIAVVALFASAAPATGRAAVDCDGPAPDAPDQASFDQREQDNDTCGEQRAEDTSQNPLFLGAAPLGSGPLSGAVAPQDPYRDPEALNGHRFRSQAISFKTSGGETLPGRLFRPCDASCTDRPPGVLAPAPPYPGVVLLHGGSARQEMYLWASEALAEDGYMVMTFQLPDAQNTGSGPFPFYTQEGLNFFMSTPTALDAAGEFNPWWAELDHAHVGLTGHSGGGVGIEKVGESDPRVGAIFSIDRAQSNPLPTDPAPTTPAFFLTADFNCQAVPVCVPQAYPKPPDPKGPGNKDGDFTSAVAAGADAMKVSLRAATHLDFTQFVPATGSRYGAVTASYYMLAWFDRYLRGEQPGNEAIRADALRRLEATTFDASADVHNISGGQYDAATGTNLPAKIAGQPVRDRLSFHFRSAWSFDGGRDSCLDIRAGCSAPTAAPPKSCSRRRRVHVILPRLRRGERYVRARVRVDRSASRRVSVSHRRRVTVSLRRRGKPAVTVRVRAKTNRGRRHRTVRRFHRCPAKHA